MSHSKVSTLISLIQWRLDEGIDLKAAYNTVITNFCEGVTEDERQELLEYFHPTQQQVTTMQATTIYYVTITRKALDSIESLITNALPGRNYRRVSRSIYINNVTPEEYTTLSLLKLPKDVSTNLK